MDIHIVWAIIAAVLIIVGIALVAFALVRSKKANAQRDITPAMQESDSRSSDTYNDVDSTDSADDSRHADGDAASATSELDVPEDNASRMHRLRSRLSHSANPFGKALFSILTRDNLSESDWEEVEDTLLLADVGADTAMGMVDELRRDARVNGAQDAAQIQSLLRAQLLKAVNTDKDGHTFDRRLELEVTPDASDTHVIMMVGVNGSGKTTTTGKLSRLLLGEGSQQIVLGAADTFRAAAADQLQTWADRVGVPVVRSDKEGADPASVAFEAAQRAKEDNAQVLIVDTAGRLQNKTNLMDELGKIRRVVEKNLPVGEVLLVLDATTGQNGMAQAKVFAEAIGITGIVLTKLDGSAKGGIVIAVQRELGVPVKLVGLGEGPDDLARFDTEGFVDGILGE
ncbi:signal recognition particle-docking protein FtsY [Alloscardovia venturai]|uniref:Signal recognition particle receptor FtsY n=1 Tax=Alloscardovia venturai TaxID=1769421 RepID=A0ABW2Y3Z0_9BIFI